MAERRGFGFTLFKALNEFQKQYKTPVFTQHLQCYPIN
jgi:hypothetical protein